VYYVMFTFVCGSVSCKETLSVSLLRNSGWHLVRFLCFLQWYLRAVSRMYKLLQFFTFFTGICTHICCTAAPAGSLIWARHKILVDHSMSFHILFSFGRKHNGDGHCLFILLFELCSCACSFSAVAFWYPLIFTQNP